MFQDKHSEYKSLVKKIIDQLGYHYTSIDWIASGSTSVAFKVMGLNDIYVVRIASPNTGKSAKYEFDFRIRSELGFTVSNISKPIATNQDVFVDGVSNSWAVDVYCEGASPARGDIPAPVCRQLAQVLRILHEIPCKNYGPLRNTRSEFQGIEQDAQSGFLKRFEQPWPFSNQTLDEHPAVRNNPLLLKPLLMLEPDLNQFGDSPLQSIVHGDLHELQFLVNESGLSVLLDFNEAFIGRPEWDLGSFLYFHGQSCFLTLLHAYCLDRAKYKQLERSAWLAAILIALHHGNRSVILDKPMRLESSMSFLEQQLLV